MRILWVKVGGLWPPDTGGRLRTFHVVSELSRRHRVTLATTHAPGVDPARVAEHLSRCEAVSVPCRFPKRGSARFLLALVRSWLTARPVDILKFRVPALRAEIRRRARQGSFDLCVADFLSATANVDLPGPLPTLFFAHNVEHLIWKRLARIETRPIRRALLEVEWRRLKAAEARACAGATLTVAVSEEDATLLAAGAPGAAVRTIPTGVDTGYFRPSPEPAEERGLVFTGSMDWLPNEDAVLHFLQAILPRVRQEVPDVSFTVVGRGPTGRLERAAAGAGVTVTGRVEDIRPHVARAAVFVVPLRIGGGTRLKIFEALAMGKAVVSTTVGAEGLPLVPGAHYLRADDPAEFARAVVLLLKDPARRRSLGDAGRRLVDERYAWPKVAEAFEIACREALAAGAARPFPSVGNGPAAGLHRSVKAWLPEGIKRHARALRGLTARQGWIYWTLRLRRALRLAPGRPHAGPGAVRSVLFVCRGNIIRSPMAAALLKRSLADRGRNGIAVSSAGLYAMRGRPADPRARAAARHFGVRLDDHRSRPMSAVLARKADLIVALDSLIEAELRGRYPRVKPRIAMLVTPREGRAPRPIDIPDPYDGDQEDVHRCYALLASCIGHQAADLLARVGGCEEVEAHHAS